jgi:DNA-binding XRE family transcriptional regulator
MTLRQFAKVIGMNLNVMNFAEVGRRRCSVDLAINVIRYTREKKLPYKMEHIYYQDLGISIAKIEQELGFKLKFD